MLNQKKAAIKEQLDKELKDFHFTKQREVLNQVRLMTWKQKVSSIWNKEIELPLIPISAVCLLLFLSFSMKGIFFENQNLYQDKELIEIGGNVYWKDELEKVVVMYED